MLELISDDCDLCDWSEWCQVAHVDGQPVGFIRHCQDCGRIQSESEVDLSGIRI